MILRSGDLQLEIFALSLNAWVRSQLDYATPAASSACDVVTRLLNLPDWLQQRAISIIYNQDPVNDIEDDLHSINYEHRSTGAYGFTEDGTPAKYDTAAGSVIGYRQWKLYNGVLNGAYGIAWSPCTRYDGRYTAKCHSKDCKNVPNENNCGCGFWAYWLPKDVQTSMYDYKIVGVIEGSGKVILGEKGFRSQYAVIRGLALNNLREKEEPEIFMGMLAPYRVPVYDDVKSLTAAVGTDPVYSPTARITNVFSAVSNEQLRSYHAIIREISFIMKSCSKSARIFSDEMLHDYGKLTQESEYVQLVLSNRLRQPVIPQER